MTARLTCGHCGTALDADAPGAPCLVCHAEAPSIVGALREPGATPRRDTGAASGSRSAPVIHVPVRSAMTSQLARVIATACALAGSDRAITAADVSLAAAIHRSEVEA